MLVEPGDILSAIFLTHAEERETFILVLFGPSLFFPASPGQCLIPYLLCSPTPTLFCSPFSTIALLLSARLLLGLISPRSDRRVSSMSQRCSLLDRCVGTAEPTQSPKKCRVGRPENNLIALNHPVMQ